MAPIYRQPNFTLEVDDGGYANRWEADEFISESFDGDGEDDDGEEIVQFQDDTYDAHVASMTYLFGNELLQTGDSVRLWETRFAGALITRLPDAVPQPYERALAQAEMIRNNGGTILRIVAEPHPDTADHHVVYYEGWSRYESGTLGG
jgi:hypothetical protein